MFEKWFKPKKTSRIEALIGIEGVVTKTILPSNSTGRAIVGGTVYEAKLFQRTGIVVGSKVIVAKVVGDVVFVKEKESKKS